MMASIAVVGIDCRLPGAKDKHAYWRLLMDGVVSDTEIPPQRWDVDAYYHPAGAAGSINTRRGHFIDDVDAFDNDFFGIAPIEAAALDPQQRLLLQTSWRALEDAGIDPRSLAGSSTGVYVGIMSSEWGSLQMANLSGITATRAMGSGYFMAANRISYHLNLTGPSVAVDSACSSSLVAIHQGCAALRSGEADTVIAAGVNLVLTPALSIFYTQAGLSAPDGRCKPFGRRADGIGRGEGVAAVVLRRLEDALTDRLPIYAVVRSSVANHDGRSNGITAPNRRSQATLLRRALASAELEAHQIDFVEAHGTGTVLGDMIEANALGDVHRIRADRPCLLGSVKGNIGHTEGSAGIAAFIKACLALSHDVLPPTLYGGDANPGLRLEALGLRLAESAAELPAGGAIGAVSSFGLGGSNAHTVLQAWPAPACGDPGPVGVLTISAPSEGALRSNAEATAAELSTVDPEHLASWCRTTNEAKRAHRLRLALQGNQHTLTGSLRRFAAGLDSDLASSAPMRRAAARVGLFCPGQGSQYRGMTRPLYTANPIYREHLDAVAAELDAHVFPGVLSAIFGAAGELHDTWLTQPALFAVSYALGRTLQDSGIRFTFGIGHSIGEVAVAALAGVLSVGDAARLVATRARLMAALPPGGSMAAVDIDGEELEALLAREDDCVIAARNGPRSVTISGTAVAVSRTVATIRERGGTAVDLAVSHAFHSPLMEPMVDEFRQSLSWLRPKPAEFAIFSTVSGREVDGSDMDPEYWARQICSPVRFHDAVQSAARASGADFFAEAGPRPTLLNLVRRLQLAQQTPALALCRGPESSGTEFLGVAATLLREGFSPDLTPLYGVPEGPRHRMPPHRFDTTNRFWFPGASASGPCAVESSATTTTTHRATGPARYHAEVGADVAVLTLVAEVGGYAVTDLGRGRLLAEDLGYDSLLQLRLLECLRAQYPQLAGVSVADALPTIRTVGDLVDFVTERLGTAGAGQ